MLNIFFTPKLKASRIVSLAKKTQVDFVGLGDSNLIFGGHGWDHGIQEALTNLGVPMWATGLITQNENNGSGSNQGYLYARQAAGVVGATSGAPADLHKFLDRGAGGLFPGRYLFVADASSVSSITLNGLFLVGNCPLNPAGALNCDIHYGTFDSGSGSFRLTVRRNSSPFTVYQSNAARNTNTGVFGMATETLSIAANAAREGLPFAMLATNPGIANIVGPCFLTYHRIRSATLSAGYSFGCLDFRGGQSTRTIAVDLQEASDEMLTHYFGILRQNQIATQKKIVIFINGGLNDRNETLASVGPAAVSDGDSPEAFVDNHQAIVDRIEEIWTLNSWDTSELTWLVVPSHPISQPDDAELIAYRAAAKAWAASTQRVLFADLGQLTNHDEMLANGWYTSAGDKLHLSQAGFTALSLRILKRAR
jgi:hypothetical protein